MLNDKNRQVKQLYDRMDKLFENGIRAKVFSGAVMAFSTPGLKSKRRFRGSYGQTSFAARARGVTSKTFFDLASLTKPLVTTLCVLQLIEAGQLHWEDTLSGYFNNLKDDDKKKIRIDMLLSHSSGFVSYRPFFKSFENVFRDSNKEKLIDNILRVSLENKPGEKTLYSDFDFIILGEIVEKITGVGLDRYFKENITDPLQLSEELFFMALSNKSPRDPSGFAATENCPWRKSLIQGEVHDEHSWLMGGVAGHAGLFGTVTGVLTICERIMDSWKGVDSLPGIGNGIIKKALTRMNNSHWCYGFDSPAPLKSSAGRLISAPSVGHLGFTGTSFWLDPIRELSMVLLTNRVHPYRDNISIREFRPAFHNAVIDFVDKQVD